jgi:hypothetical protein
MSPLLWLLVASAAGALVWGLVVAAAVLLAGIVNAVEWVRGRIVR